MNTQEASQEYDEDHEDGHDDVVLTVFHSNGKPIESREMCECELRTVNVNRSLSQKGMYFTVLPLSDTLH